jgi:hypothetical protein
MTTSIGRVAIATTEESMLDVRGKRVLVFGDSLTHRGAREAPDAVIVTEGIFRGSSSPGDLLASQALLYGAYGARINGRVSRSAWSFLTKEAASAILAQELAWKPDVVIIMLGTNDLGLSTASNQRYFTQLRDAFASRGVEVWGIGPPAFADAELAAQADSVVAVERGVYGSRFLDLRPLTDGYKVFGRTSDGIHFTTLVAPLVASAIAKQIFGSPGAVEEPARVSRGAVGLIVGGLAIGAAGLFFAFRAR